jgi:GNAT superfamily N-acetyltransferase
MNYTQPYYQQLFENYGFKNFFNQICFALHAKDLLAQKFFDRHAECAKDPNFSSSHIKKNQLDKFAADFTMIYNKAWAGHGGLKQLDEKIVRKMFQSMKPVMDEKISWFAYYKGEPIGMWINLPDLNQWFKHLHGKFSLWHKLKFLWLKSTLKPSKFVGLVFGVVPEFQGKGVESYIIIEGAFVIQSLKLSNGQYQVGKLLYDEYEMQWIGEFNPKMVNVAEALGTYRSRKLTTYRYLFDRTKEFKRHPVLL